MPMSMLRFLTPIATIVLLTACATQGGAGRQAFDDAWLHHQADWTAYSTVYLAPVEVVFSDEKTLTATGTRLGSARGAVERLREQIADLWTQRIASALGSRGFRVVDSAQSASLKIETRIDEIVLMPAFDDTAQPIQTYARQTARARLTLTVTDPSNGSTLLRIRDRDESREDTDLHPRSAAEARHDLERILGRWARAATDLMGR